MEIVRVPVRFEGHIDIQVPPGLRDDQKKDLAERIALSTILATTNNPDCGEAQQDALDEYAQKFGLDDQLAESDWDRCQVHMGPWGSWTSPQT